MDTRYKREVPLQGQYEGVVWRGCPRARGGRAKANAPLSTLSEYFGTAFEQATPESQALMISEWRRAVYEGHHGGPSILEANRILEAAGVRLLSLQQTRALLTG
jgi:hypothetical protein